MIVCKEANSFCKKNSLKCTQKNRTRRHILKGAGALITLPALESLGMGESGKNEKKALSPPKRMVFMGMGFGITNETWFPNREEKGKDYTLSNGLEPLKHHKKDFTLVQGCSHQYTKDAHYGSTFWLTGANRYGVPGQKFSNTISADQVAAKVLGQDTRFSSIQLDSENAESSEHGPGLSLAWDENGKPISGINSPLKLFHTMFSEENLSLEQRQC